MLYWYAIPAVAAVLGGSAIFAFSSKLRSFHKYMGFTLIFEGLMFMLAGTLFTSSAVFYLPTYLLYLTMLLVSPFFYYFATLHLLSEKGAEGKDYWMLEVVVVFMAVFMAVIPSIGNPEREAFFSVVTGRDLTPDSTGVQVLLTFDTLAYLFFLVEELFIQLYCIFKLANYYRLLEDCFSNLEGKSYPAVKAVPALMLLRLLVLVCFAFSGEASAPTWLAVLQVSVSVLFYAIVAVLVCRIGYTAEELGKILNVRNTREQRPAADEIIESRLSHLIVDKFYLNPEADLSGVSSALQVNTRYVTDYIRYHYGETFMNFVNRLRIEHAMTLLANPSVSVNDVAENSGFATPSTFYRNFVKLRGVTPSQYRESVCKS